MYVCARLCTYEDFRVHQNFQLSNNSGITSHILEHLINHITFSLRHVRIDFGFKNEVLKGYGIVNTECR